MKKAREYKERREAAEGFGWWDVLTPEDVKDLRDEVKSRARYSEAVILPESNKKATYKSKDGAIVLTSYYTDVCKIEGGQLVKTWNGWSKTTAGHIAEFCRIFHKKTPSKYEWIMTDNGQPIKYEA